MKSRWFGLKNEAIRLRKSGKAIRFVETKLGIPRSTLSGWFKDIELSQTKKNILKNKWKKALVYARAKAILWHNQGKAERLNDAEKYADEVLGKIDLNDKSVLELALAMLYLGEGFKTKNTGMGNSDKKILKLFLSCIEKLYAISRNTLSCHLHLRADQNPDKMKRFWSKELNIPFKNFLATSLDMRTKNKPTYKHYKGVCIISVGNIAIQRRLLYLSDKFCEKITNTGD